MERAIEETTEYCRERKAFGKSILDNQIVHYRLAELQAEVELLRSTLYRAVGKILIGGRGQGRGQGGATPSKHIYSFFMS